MGSPTIQPSPASRVSYPQTFFSVCLVQRYVPLPWIRLQPRLPDSIYQEHGFVSANLSCCDRLEEVRFFAGMFSPANMPFGKMDAALRSATSRKMKMVILDLNTDKAPDRNDRQVLCGLERLDQQLCRIASHVYCASTRLTVKLSASDPYALGRRLPRFRRVGQLVVGTRYRNASSPIFAELHWIGDYKTNAFVDTRDVPGF